MNGNTQEGDKMNTLRNIAARLGSTDLRCGTTWDPQLLKDAARACFSMQEPCDFDGRPTDGHEYARFAAAWRSIQDDFDL